MHDAALGETELNPAAGVLHAVLEQLRPDPARARLGVHDQPPKLPDQIVDVAGVEHHRR